jgi:hypothetical protein
VIVSSRGILWTCGALLGIVATAAVAWSASQLAGQQIGLSSEPLSVVSRLAPPAAPPAPRRALAPHRAARPRQHRPAPRAAIPAAAPAQAQPVAVAATTRNAPAQSLVGAPATTTTATSTTSAPPRQREDSSGGGVHTRTGTGSSTDD